MYIIITWWKHAFPDYKNEQLGKHRFGSTGRQYKDRSYMRLNYNKAGIGLDWQTWRQDKDRSYIRLNNNKAE